MFNVLLDELPRDWNGIPIDTDYQTGILLSQCMADETLSDYEKFACAANLLFPGEKPSAEEIGKAVQWFLSGYDHDNHAGEKKSDVQVMDWDIDQWRIYAAFRSQYGIDLTRVRMHWFVFMGLMANLEECAFNRVMHIRQKKITPKMSRDEKKATMEAKRIFGIKKQVAEKPLSAEEQQRLKDFMKYAQM